MQSISLKSQEVLVAIQGWEFWHEIQIGVQKEYTMPKEEFERLLPEYWKFMGLIAFRIYRIRNVQH